jgi:hypothetical protein
MDEVTRKRYDKSNDNAEVTPVMLLEACLEDIRAGRTRCNKLLIICVYHDPESLELERYRANVTRLDETGILALAQHRHIRRWLGDDV